MSTHLWTILYGGWLSAVVLLSLDPSPPEIEVELLSWDKFQHAGAYAGLTALGGLCWCRWLRFARRCWLVSAAIAVSVGILLEVAQGRMNAGRVADWQDAAANAVGASGILLLVAFIRFRRSRRLGR